MKPIKLLGVGDQLGIAIPRDFERALGWVRGDVLSASIKGGDLVIRNSSKRAAKFTRDFQSRKESQLDGDHR